jgi:hypothetical protein
MRIKNTGLLREDAWRSAENIGTLLKVLIKHRMWTKNSELRLRSNMVIPEQYHHDRGSKMSEEEIQYSHSQSGEKPERKTLASAEDPAPHNASSIG